MPIFSMNQLSNNNLEKRKKDLVKQEMRRQCYEKKGKSIDYRVELVDGH